MLQRRRFGDCRRGSVSVLTAFLLVFMMALVAFVVDIGNLCRVDTQTQAVADAASLAGARGLATSPAQVRSLAIACAQQNSANGQSVALQDANIVLGTWTTTTRTFTALSGSAESQANACQVNVSLNSAGGNPVSLYFAQVLGQSSANVSSSATAAVGRWDVVLCCDRSASFATDLSEAVTGMQDILTAFNTYSPSSNIGVVTFDGVAYTNASLQAVGTNYSSLQTTINNIVDCSVGGPPCSGSDLAAGMATAVSLFSASGYNPPSGTRKAIIFISDGAANVTSASLNSSLSDDADNTLAATEASNAYTNSGISVFSLLYYHGSDSTTDTNAMQALIQGQGTFFQETTPSLLATDLQSIIMNNLSMKLVQ